MSSVSSVKSWPRVEASGRSDRNTLPEIERKAALYFARGAKEVWVCDKGHMSFYVAGSVLDASQLAPNFPPQVHLPE